MNDVATKAKKIDGHQCRPQAAETTALQHCYGKIGISAVAAAVRYQGAGKNHAYAPSATRWQERNSEEAA